MMKRFLLIIGLFFSTGFLWAQEICDNGLDDDGDGLVDLNDPDCACSGVLTSITSMIPNPSFEDTLCCPGNFSQLDCADTWVQASDATSDYYNVCDFTHFGGFHPPPFPLPGGGSGYAGFVNYLNYHEMIGACLGRPMRADTAYRMSLFMARGHSRAAPLVLSIFGTSDCGELPWGGEGCPVGVGSWMLLGMDTVEFLDSIWQQAVIEFTPTQDIQALAIGGPCGVITQGLLNNYYYIDELMVAAVAEFNLNAKILESGKWCTNDLRLHAGIDTSGGSWQWYRSGIALPGETTDSLNLMHYGVDDTFAVVYSLGGECIRVEHRVDTADPANRPRALFVENADTIVCKDAVIPVSATATRGYHFQWSPAFGVSDPNALMPEITVTRDTPVYYELTASYPGCPDTAMGFWVDMEWVSVDLAADTLVCWGDLVPLLSEVVPPRSDYRYSWTPESAGLELVNSRHNYFLSDSSVTYSLEVFSPRGCSDKDSIIVTVQPRSFAEVIADTGYCPPEAIKLWARGGSAYRWTPAYGLDTLDIAEPVASPATPTVYTVYVTSDYGCRDTQEVFVDVYPHAIINMPDTIRIYPGEQYHLEPGTNCHYFNWFPTNGINSVTAADPIFYPEVRTRYFVDARTEQGCTIRDSIDVLVEGTVIDMPNAFVPGRGVVPVLKPAKRGIAELIEFSVYNRWGNKVFSTTDIEQGWDGSYKGKPQPLGVYVYQIEAITDAGQRFRKEGDVTLIR